MKKTIAIIIPVTSRCRSHKCIEDTELISIFLPSFVKSIRNSNDFVFKIYVGCDKGDSLYDNDKAAEKIHSLSNNIVSGLPVSIHYFKSIEETQHAPCLVWNYLFKIAYQENCDYFYQVGDDISFIDGNWAQEFVKFIDKNNGIGVTGPTEVRNTTILTQSFVGRKHMDIFGYYFPPAIKNWYSDNWITNVYSPSFMFKQSKFSVLNSLPKSEDMKKFGNERYNIVHISFKELNEMIKNGKKMIEKHIQSINSVGFQ